MNGLIKEPGDYTIGRALVDGTDHHKAVPFADLPACYEAAAEITQIVENEGREDIIIEKDNEHFYMNDDGTLFIGGFHENLPLTEWSLGQIATKITPTKARADAYFLHVWPELRAHNFNEHIHHYWHPSRRRPIRVRTKQLEVPHVFAVVSKLYGAFDIDYLSQVVAEEVPEDCRAEVVYSYGRHLKLSIVFDDTIKVGEAPYNYEFHPMLVIETSDDGTSNISIVGGIRTDATESAMIFDGRHLATFERRHIESSAADRPKLAVEFRHKLGESFEAMDLVRNLFTAHWDEATHLQVLDASAEAPKDLFEYLVERGHVQAGGLRIRRRELVDLLVASYQRRPDRSKAAVIEAILHVAHTGGWHPVVEDAMQRQAGRLLMSNIILNRR